MNTYEPVCKCGHLASDHREDDGTTGTCALCGCGKWRERQPVPTTPGAVDAEARKMLAALEARLDAALARIDALEAGRAVGPVVVCECGHAKTNHTDSAGTVGLCWHKSETVTGMPCDCMEWRPMPQVTP